MTVRLEVQLPDATWLDVMGSTGAISVTRSPMQLGQLTARLADVDLDPAKVDTLASGRPIRLMAQTAATTWQAMFTGRISASRADYGKPNAPGANPQRAVRIDLTAVDLIQELGADSEARSVATTNELRTLLAAAGVPWRVNGTATAGPANPVVVANNPGSFLADQVALTRDTVAGHAWVDSAGVLQVRDPASMPTAAVATYTDLVDGNPSYRDIDAAYDSADVVDAVEVTFLKYKPSAGVTEQVTHTVRRAGSTGTNVRTYTIGGPAATDAQIKAACEAYAQKVLDRHASAVVRPLGLTTPLRTHAERLAAFRADLCARVRVVLADRSLDAHVRVASIEHQIDISAAANPVKWIATYTYDTPEAVPESQTLSLVRPALIQDRLEAAETTAAQGVDPVATAARLTGQVITDLQTAAAGEPRWTLGSSGTRQTIQADTARGDQTSPGGLTVNVGTSRAAVTVESPGINARKAGLDLSSPYSNESPTLATLSAQDILLNGQNVNLGRVVDGELADGPFKAAVRDAGRVPSGRSAVVSIPAGQSFVDVTVQYGVTFANPPAVLCAPVVNSAALYGATPNGAAGLSSCVIRIYRPTGAATSSAVNVSAYWVALGA